MGGGRRRRLLIAGNAYARANAVGGIEGPQGDGGGDRRGAAATAAVEVEELVTWVAFDGGYSLHTKLRQPGFEFGGGAIHRIPRKTPGHIIVIIYIRKPDACPFVFCGVAYS